MCASVLQFIFTHLRYLFSFLIRQHQKAQQLTRAISNSGFAGYLKFCISFNHLL